MTTGAHDGGSTPTTGATARAAHAAATDHGTYRVALLPTWVRRAFLATAVMNILATVLFLPPAASLRALAGVPPGEHAVYLVTLAMFVLLFGLAYLYAGLTGRADPLFVALTAGGKLSFVAVLVACWAAGEVSARAPLAAAGDLGFGLLFLTHLLSSRARA
jgi:hypothetical protein